MFFNSSRKLSPVTIRSEECRDNPQHHPVIPEPSLNQGVNLEREDLAFHAFPGHRSFVLHGAYGEPTLVSISRRTSEKSSDKWGEAERIIADQNLFSERHSLRFTLWRSSSGEQVLKGHVEELGRVPHEYGHVFQDNKVKAIEFQLCAPQGDTGTRYNLQRAAWRLVERFVDHGIWGANSFLDECEGRGLYEGSWVYRRPELIEELEELRALLEGPGQPFKSGEEEEEGAGVHPWIATIRRTSRELSEPIVALWHGSFYAFSNVWSKLQAEGQCPFSFSNEPIFKRLLQYRYHLPIGRLWAHFETPLVDVRNAELYPRDGKHTIGPLSIRLRLPCVLVPTVSDLSHLQIEIVNAIPMPHTSSRYIAYDRDNVLNISTQGYNEELFERLFSAMHRINLAHQFNIPARQENVGALLDTLRAFGLTPRARWDYFSMLRDAIFGR